MTPNKPKFNLWTYPKSMAAPLTPKPQKPKLCEHGVNVKYCVACQKVKNPKKEEIMYDSDFSPDQLEAIKLIETEKMVFLTGKAGTGKSYIIHYLRHKYGDKCAVTATTGIAAQLIKGQTIHRFASLHPSFGAVSSRKADTRMGQIKLLIVDEISMASSQLVDQIFDRIHQSGNEPKVVFVGDFLQLPPVEGNFAFESKHWKRFKTAKLTHNHRQDDLEFINVLNDLRMGTITDRVKAFVKERTVAKLPSDCTLLYPMRYQVDNINNEKLAQLPGKMKMAVWDWKYVGPTEEEDFTLNGPKKKTKVEIVEPKEHECRFEQVLKLKVGARIVLLTNSEEWANGSTGEVLQISADGLSVRLDTGKTVLVKQAIETLHGPYGNALYEINQFPVMLAWGLTIHKAQGMSLDRVGVYLGKHFEDSQTYVALSRCRTREGLYLEGILSHVGTNQKALAMCGE